MSQAQRAAEWQRWGEFNSSSLAPCGRVIARALPSAVVGCLNESAARVVPFVKASESALA